MISSIHRSLAKKREMLRNNEKGFTLIELLVVVLIIGILAAIAIPIYLSVQQTAKDNSAKSSAAEAKTAVVAWYTEKNAMPATLSAAGYNASATDFQTAYFSTTAGAFCISVRYLNSAKYYKVTDVASVVEAAAACTTAAS